MGGNWSGSPTSTMWHVGGAKFSTATISSVVSMLASSTTSNFKSSDTSLFVVSCNGRRTKRLCVPNRSRVLWLALCTVEPRTLRAARPVGAVSKHLSSPSSATSVRMQWLLPVPGGPVSTPIDAEHTVCSACRWSAVVAAMVVVAARSGRVQWAVAARRRMASATDRSTCSCMASAMYLASPQVTTANESATARALARACRASSVWPRVACTADIGTMVSPLLVAVNTCQVAWPRALASKGSANTHATASASSSAPPMSNMVRYGWAVKVAAADRPYLRTHGIANGAGTPNMITRAAESKVSAASASGKARNNAEPYSLVRPAAARRLASLARKTAGTSRRNDMPAKRSTAMDGSKRESAHATFMARTMHAASRTWAAVGREGVVMTAT